jgi:hypothetical protein
VAGGIRQTEGVTKFGNGRQKTVGAIEDRMH